MKNTYTMLMKYSVNNKYAPNSGSNIEYESTKYRAFTILINLSSENIWKLMFIMIVHNRS